MKNCSSCGAPLREGAKFCPVCGAACPEEAPAPAFCPACGAPLEKDDAFCLSCGAKIADVVPQRKPAAQNAAAPKPKKPRNGKKRKIVLISVITAAVLLLGVGGFFLIRHLTGANDPLKRAEASVDVHADVEEYSGEYIGTLTCHISDPNLFALLGVPVKTARDVDGNTYEAKAHLNGVMEFYATVLPKPNHFNNIVVNFPISKDGLTDGVWQEIRTDLDGGLWADDRVYFLEDGSLFAYSSVQTGYGRDAETIAVFECELELFKSY